MVFSTGLSSIPVPMLKFHQPSSMAGYLGYVIAPWESSRQLSPFALGKDTEENPAVEEGVVLADRKSVV